MNALETETVTGGTDLVAQGEMASVEPVSADDRDEWRHLIDDLETVDLAVVNDAIDDTGLLAAHVDLLLRLRQRRDHRSPMNALAGEMRISGSSLTKIVDRLTELGLVERDASESDRRVVYVVLTAAGVEQGNAIRARWVAAVRRRVLAVLGRSGLIELARVARQIG